MSAIIENENPVEIEVESSPIEASPEEGVSEEETLPIHKVRKNASQIIDSLNREKYQLQSELDAVRRQAQEYHKAAVASLDFSTKQYNETLLQRMARIKDEKIKARAEGDVEAETQADMAMSLVGAELSRAQHLQPPTDAQPSLPPQTPVMPFTPPEYINADVANEWGARNTWFNPQMPDFDPLLRQQVDAFCAQSDQNLRANGMGEYIWSPEYFAEVDKHVHKLRKLRNESSGELNMSAPRGSVTGVSRTPVNALQPRQAVRLSDAEMKMVKALGIDAREYAKNKVQDQKERPEWWR